MWHRVLHSTVAFWKEGKMTDYSRVNTNEEVDVFPHLYSVFTNDLEMEILLICLPT